MYANYFKRIFDFILSLCAIIALSPILCILTVFGIIFMGGNPLFFQERPGKDGKIFKLIKFRTMNNRKDENGVLLPNEERLNRYGRVLRSTSLDELPELCNILKGDMSIVGPRPLLPEYLPYYTSEEQHRHDLRPGLTGLAQVNGRNAIESWEERFAYDLDYVHNCSLMLDITIIIKTIGKVVHRSGISSGITTAHVGRLDEIRRKESHNDIK